VWEVRITDEAGKLVCISRCTLAVIEQRSTYTTADARG
jgi:acyl-coenzyme A thioesterase PaaI-like protein